MLHTTRAIVLRTIRHGDRTTILKAYTELLGVRSCIVHLARRRGMGAALLQPLNRLELVLDERSGRELSTVREARIEKPFDVHGDPVRGALLLFVQEILIKTLREESPDPRLFTFLGKVIDAIEHGHDTGHFPLVFLVRFSEYLGFLPSPPEEGEKNFDLLEGHFVRGDAPSGRGLMPPLSTALAQLLAAELGHVFAPTLPSAHRRALLDQLLLYYRLHVEGLGELRSPEVLRQVLD